MTKVIGMIIMMSALVAGAGSHRNVGFKRDQLSEKGQVAYDRLFSTCVFRIGSVGFAGTTSEEELALYDLLDEAHAAEALKTLVAQASYEGGLYGLVGLSLKSNTEFNRAVYVYKARQQRPETSKGKSIACNAVARDTDEHVVTQSGCLFMTELRAAVVTKIQSGAYDSQLLPKYRPGR